MAAAYDAIAAGEAPGISAVEDLFDDNIHVNDAGAYLIALAHFAVLYGVGPGRCRAEREEQTHETRPGPTG